MCSWETFDKIAHLRGNCTTVHNLVRSLQAVGVLICASKNGHAGRLVFICARRCEIKLDFLSFST